MADIYKIVTELTITGAWQRQLNEIASLFAGIDKQIVKTNGLMGRLTLGKGAFEGLSKLNKEMGLLSGTAGKVSTSINKDFVRAFGGVRNEANTVKAAIGGWGTEVAAVERRVNDLIGKLRSAGSAGGRSIRRPGRGPGVLDTIAMGPTESGILAGMNVERIGGGILHRSGELQRQTNLFKMAGNSQSDAAMGLQAAYNSARTVPDINVTEQFKLFRELSAATQDNAGSAALLPEVAKARSVISAATGRENEEDMRRLFKFIELRGKAIDPKQHKIIPKMFVEELDAATKALVVGQGLLTTNDLQQFVRQAGPMAKGMSSDDLYMSALAAMEDMGGARTGTSLSAVGRQFVGGTMTSKVAGVLNDFGLLTGKGQEVSDAGKITITDPAKAIKGYDTLTKGTFKDFIDKEVRPALEAKGITSRDDQNKQVYRIFGTDTARRMGSLYLSSPEQVDALGHRYKQAMGINAYDNLLGGGKDFETASKGVSEAFTTLKTALGDAQGIAPVLNSIAHAITGLADAVKDRPGVGTAATLGVVGTGAAAMGYGALKTLTGFGLPAAATQLSTAAVALEAAAAKLGGGDLAKDVAKNAASGGVLAALGLTGVTLGTIAGGAFAGYATAKTMPGVAAKGGATAIDPATGGGMDANPMGGMGPSRPYIADWIKSWFTTPGAKEAAETVGKQSAVTVTDGFKTGPFEVAGSAAAGALVKGFLTAFAGMGGGSGIQTASFGGGGFGGLIQKASLGGANDNAGLGGGSVGRALAGGGGGNIPALPGSIQMTDDERNKLGLILKYESHGQNTMNYMGKRQGLDPRTAKGYTAQGYFQMLNSNWRRIAPKLGITAPNAMAGSLEDQARVALDLLRHGGIGNWSNFNPALRGALRRGERAPSGASAPPPTAGPPPRGPQMVQVHSTIMMDRKVVARQVAGSIAEQCKFPRHIGGQDGHGSWVCSWHDPDRRGLNNSGRRDRRRLLTFERDKG